MMCGPIVGELVLSLLRRLTFSLLFRHQLRLCSSGCSSLVWWGSTSFAFCYCFEIVWTLGICWEEETWSWRAIHVSYALLAWKSASYIFSLVVPLAWAAGHFLVWLGAYLPPLLDMIVQARSDFGSSIFRDISIVACWSIWCRCNAIIFDNGVLSLARWKSIFVYELSLILLRAKPRVKLELELFTRSWSLYFVAFLLRLEDLVIHM
jgi:hypothetical protein